MQDIHFVEDQKEIDRQAKIIKEQALRNEFSKKVSWRKIKGILFGWFILNVVCRIQYWREINKTDEQIKKEIRKEFGTKYD